MREIKYSDKPVTLGQLLALQRGGAGDWEATFKVILTRTDLTEEEVLALDVEDMNTVMAGITKGITAATALQQIGKSL